MADSWRILCRIKDVELKRIYIQSVEGKVISKFCTSLSSWYLLEPSPISNIRIDLVNGYNHCYEDRVLDSTLLSLAYWESILQQFNKELNSKVLKMMFYFIEDAPLLCILRDFLPELDDFFSEREVHLSGINFNPLVSPSEQVEIILTLQRSNHKFVHKACPVQGEETGASREGVKNKGEGCTGVGDVEEDDDPSVTNIDERYVHALEMYCLLKQRFLDVKYNWKTVVKDALSDHGRMAGFAQTYYSCIVSTLESLVGIAENILVETLSSQKDPQDVPKFVQLCEQLNLSDKEQDSLRYIFIQNVGVLFGKLHSRFLVPVSTNALGGSKQASMALSAASFAQMSSREMLEFFDSSREHLKQELLEPEDEFSSLQMTSFIKMPSSALKACCGCKLSAEDRYKIDKTTMGEIMSRRREKGPLSTTRVELHGEARDISELEGEGEEEEELATAAGEDTAEADKDKELLVELEDILNTCSDDLPQRPSASAKSLVSANVSESDGHDLAQPYTSDLEYLEDSFQLIETLGKALKIEDDDDSFLLRADQRKPEAVIRELKAKSRSLNAKIKQKLEATQNLEGWLPRLERLALLRGLDQFEKNVLLVLTGSMVSKNLRRTGNSSAALFGHHLSIGSIISLFCDGLKEQIDSRVYFYKNSKLVSGALIHVSDPPLHTRGNFLDSAVELDRRLLDYIVGLDTEINELVDGSDLYTPDVTMSQVSLPKEHKQLLLNTFQSFEKFQKTCEEFGLSSKGSRKGVCLLFYGPSGTGKTMTANAVANYLKKKVLLVTMSLLLDKDLTKELLRFLFREAKIHNALLFFDECECLFESRDFRSNPTLGILLTEIEQYSGVIILATNRHQDLDEAMHRRIQLALPFSVPDYALREEIWKSHVPSSIASEDINWSNLALSHELTGGLISNAVLSALSLAVKRCHSDEEKPLLTESLLTTGAKLQLRGLLEMVDFERRIIPTFGIQDLVLEEDVKRQLQLVLNAGKTHKFISAQWGFGGAENVAKTSGITCLITGVPGAGKTALARAIAYELGQPIKEANCTELLSHTVNAQPRAARGVAAFFRDAQKANAIVVLDGSEIMLSTIGNTLMTGIVGCEHLTLMHQIEHFSGIVIITSRREASQLDLNRMPKLKYVMELNVPTILHREELWRMLIPKNAPISSDINYRELAERFIFTGGDIASTICQAAEVCAMEANSNSPGIISYDKLLATAEFESKRKDQRTFLPSIFS